VSGAGEGVFLKLVRPDKIQQLHDEHKRLPEELPVPRSLGLSRELGLMAMQSMAGLTLREALENPSLPLPPPEAVTGLVASLPQPKDRKVRASIIERVPALAEVVSAALPDVDAEVRRFVDRLGSEDVDELAPVHGDYYEAQILVDGSSVVGLLDVDTYGLGRPGDDPGVMIGHLALWQTMSSQAERAGSYLAGLLEVWDETHDPSDIRRRAAATLLTLATGPFRVQTADWPGETRARVALAHEWLDRAGR